MAGSQLVVVGAQPARDQNGRALPSLLKFYLPDTTTLAVIYADQALTVPLLNPVASDASGRFPQMWADEDDTFTVGWFDQITEQQIAVYENITPLKDGLLESVVLAEAAQEAAEEAAAEAAASAAAAAASDGGVDTVATTSTNLTVGTGTKAFTLDQTGKDYAVGMLIVLVDVATRTKVMVGRIDTFASPAVTMTVATASGAGSSAFWSVWQAPEGGVISVAGLTGIVGALALGNALNLTASQITDFESASSDIAVAFAIAL